MKRPKVLLATQAYSEKDYILFGFIEYIKQFSYDSYKIIVFDNDKNPIHPQKVSLFGKVDCIHVNPGTQKGYERLAISQEIARQYAIQNRYDFLFSLECDVFPPKNIIEHLIALQKKVVSAMYLIEKKIVLQEHENFADTGIENTTEYECYRKINGLVKRVFSCGLGCTMIHRSVFEQVKFRIDKDLQTYSDTVFYVDCNRLQIPVYLDTSIICEHFTHYKQDEFKLWKK